MYVYTLNVFINMKFSKAISYIAWEIKGDKLCQIELHVWRPHLTKMAFLNFGNKSKSDEATSDE